MDRTAQEDKVNRLAGGGLKGLLALVLLGFSWASIPGAAAEFEPSHEQLLPGDRVLLGTVEEVRSDQARVDTGELQPRFIPMGVRKEKGCRR